MNTCLQTDNLLDSRRPFVITIILPDLVGEAVVALGESRPRGRLRRGIVVFPAQETHLQRGEGGQADPAARVQPLELPLDLASIQHVVQRLLHDGPNET